MNKTKLSILLSASLLLSGACSNGTRNPSEAAKQHSQWEQSLNDSLAAVRQAVEENMQLTEALDSTVAKLSSHFSSTANPKFVENYVMVKGFTNYNTESHTGVIARITESGEFELIATLRGGTFSAIEISDGSESVRSATVPYDKALNYRTSAANIVAFKGSEADSIGDFIASHQNKSLKISFFSEGKKQSSADISEVHKKMISLTWDYINATNRKEKAERQFLLLSEKAKILETRINESKQ